MSAATTINWRGTWLGFIARRLAGLVLVLVFLLIAAFAMVRLIPGDPALLVAGSEITPANLARIRAQLGVDQPWPAQFLRYTAGLAHGDLGVSFASSQPVSQIIGDRMLPTAQLAFVSLAVCLLVSIPLGMMVAHLTRDGRNRRLELVWTAVSAAAGSVPAFLTAVILVVVFAVYLGIFPVAGREGWRSLVLPVASIALGPTLALARIVRLQVLDVLAQDYLRTARSKRLSMLVIYLRHVLPNVLTVALTVGGVLFSGLVAGTVFVETIFARLGMGSALVDGILGHDYPVVQAVVLMLGAIVVVVNALIDILIGLVDPRSLAGKN